jgi:phosphate:Na+ symporter
MEDEVSIRRVVLLVLMGLAVFLYSIGHLTKAMKAVAGDRLERWLHRYTRHLASALAVGIGATMVLQSSSVVIILTIVLVNSGLMSFRNAMGVVLGANIGTTFSSQLIAFDIGEWSAVPLLIGLLLEQVSRSSKWRSIGTVVFSFGLLFAALYMMGYAMLPLKNDDLFVAWLHGLEDPLKGALFGGLITLVIQSSSATVAMAITMAGKGLLTLPAGIALMLGAELGTCSDTLLATLRTDRQALKVGLFHMGFNLVTIILGLLLITPFTSLAIWLSGDASAARSIANAHMLFNVIGVALMIPFVPKVAALMDRLVTPGRKAVDTSAPLPQV